ncbi:hypothetical protein F4814DRAFT_457787 [Daldinia grandis]|nr:hypothetical protein F4814DRAFT_457787 [Daldinia grandis]
MGERYISSPIVYNHFPGGFGGTNHETRLQIYGSPVQYRPGIETPLGRLLSTYASMWNIHPSQLFPRALGGEIDLIELRNRHALRSNWNSDPGGLFRRALIQSAFDRDVDRNVAKKDSSSEQSTTSQDSDESSNEVDVPDTEVRRGITLYSQIRDLFELERDDALSKPPVRVILECPVCSDQLKFVHPSYAEWFIGSAEGPEQAAVLPCGHIMGLNCMLQWIIECVEEGNAPSCPVCRFRLRYSDHSCNHIIHPYIVTLQSPLPPLTMPEGGHLHSTCLICRGTERTWDRAVWD